jgi:D-xylose transport system substrate-binding protein
VSTRTVLMIASLALSLAIGWVVARGGGAGGARRASDQPLIGLSMATLQQARWQRDRDAFVTRARDLGAEVLVQSANNDDTRQIADVEALISRGVDVLVIIANDSTAMARAVDLAHQAGVPVIAYDKIVRDSDLDLFMSFDNLRVGELQARYAVDHLPTPGRGRVVRIYGARSDDNTRLLKRGQDQVLDDLIKRGDVEVVHEDYAEDWRPENAKRITNAAITRLGTQGFDAVIASNDGTAGGAIQALLEAGMSGRVIVTGQDAELVACQRIVAGSQSMTVYKPLQRLATRVAEVAVKLARRQVVVAPSAVNNGKIDVPAILTDVELVTRENLESTVIRDGFHRREDLFTERP